jgi:hypothetical protein
LLRTGSPEGGDVIWEGEERGDRRSNQGLS